MRKAIKWLCLSLVVGLLVSCELSSNNPSGNINFNFGGAKNSEGTVIEDYSVVLKTDELLTLPEDVYKTGYVFGGWLQDNGLPWVFNTMLPQKAMNLTINWLDGTKEYLTYIIDSEVVYRSLHSANNNLAISEDKYTFEGWYLEPNFKTPVTFPVSTSVSKIYGKMEPNDKETEGLQYALNSTKDGYLVTKYVGNDVRVYVPSTYLSLPVIGIDNYAFYNSEKLTRIELPNSIKTIGKYAFGDCFKLAYIDLPDDIKIIEEGAFVSNFALQSVSFGDSIEIIHQEAFYYCTSLEVVNLPATLTYIDDWAFYGCASLKMINVDSLNQVYQTVDGVLYSKDLTTLYIYPSNKASMSYEVLEQTLTISGWAFSRVINLSEIILPSGLTIIESFAFSYCHNVKSFKIPENITNIKRYAFYEFDELELQVSMNTDTTQFENLWNNSGVTNKFYNIVNY